MTKSETVDIASSIHLKNCLLVPNLSHKLLSVSQLTKEFNCTVMFTSDSCIVQDAQTKTIIGHELNEEVCTMWMRRLKKVKHHIWV